MTNLYEQNDSADADAVRVQQMTMLLFLFAGFTLVTAVLSFAFPAWSSSSNSWILTVYMFGVTVFFSALFGSSILRYLKTSKATATR